MIKQFVYGDFKLDYILISSNRKSMSITVHPNLQVVVRVPEIASEIEIEQFLKKKYTWLQKKLDFYKQFLLEADEIKYISGSSVLHLGKQYKLIVKQSENESVFKDGNNIIILTSKEIDNSDYNLALLNRFYDESLEKVFKRRFKACVKLFDSKEAEGITYKPRKMQKRWGSYQPSKNTVLLNTELIKADRKCIDYVISHELCHIFHKTHNKEFYKLLSSKIPNYKDLENKLELRFIGYTSF